ICLQNQICLKIMGKVAKSYFPIRIPQVSPHIVDPKLEIKIFSLNCPFQVLSKWTSCVYCLSDFRSFLSALSANELKSQ
ncbi:Uncharacterized protein APZ42_003924, partial [Daphnia magna]